MTALADLTLARIRAHSYFNEIEAPALRRMYTVLQSYRREIEEARLERIFRRRNEFDSTNEGVLHARGGDNSQQGGQREISLLLSQNIHARSSHLPSASRASIDRNKLRLPVTRPARDTTLPFRNTGRATDVAGARSPRDP